MTAPLSSASLSARASLRLLAVLGLAAGCGGDIVLRTAIQVSFDNDGDAVRAEADQLVLVVEPEDPYTDDEGNLLSEGEYGSSSLLLDWNLDGEDLELIVLTDVPSSGDLPVVELRPGDSYAPITITAAAFDGTTQTMESEPLGPLGFTVDEVTNVSVSLLSLDTPITACENGRDDDEDGWTDGEDPDCADGTDETGTTDSACNDGDDNDGDGAIDADDADCAAGTQDYEVPPCSDGDDNDGDGWADEADPDCADGIEELGLGSTACNDGEDNDEDGDIDGGDGDCDDAFDDDESSPPCNDGEDNDGDGWTDDEDPDCLAGDEEIGVDDAYECNDGEDNDGDGTIDADDPSCDR